MNDKGGAALLEILKDAAPDVITALHAQFEATVVDGFEQPRLKADRSVHTFPRHGSGNPEMRRAFKRIPTSGGLMQPGHPYSYQTWIR
jgi:hypothetical protein